MYAICLRYHRDSDLANEALQRGFIKVYEKLSAYKGKNQLSGWIRSIIIRTCIDVLKERQKLQYEVIDQQYDITDTQTEYEQPEIGFQDMLTLLDKLPDGYRAVFSMYVLDGLSHNEIAQLLKITPSTSRSQLAKSRKMMQALVKRHFSHLLIKE